MEDFYIIVARDDNHNHTDLYLMKDETVGYRWTRSFGDATRMSHQMAIYEIRSFGDSDHTNAAEYRQLIADAFPQSTGHIQVRVIRSVVIDYYRPN